MARRCPNGARFGTQGAADRKLEQLRQAPVRTRLCRAYMCGLCRGWHLTATAATLARR